MTNLTVIEHSTTVPVIQAASDFKIDSAPYVLWHGDVIDELADIPANSVDSIVTDPPYELGFMGKAWDSTGIAYNVQMWKECLRVLKPGGHLLAFGGSRTYHRMASAVEDAGFEIRDQIMWVYGQGFPKGQDVGKAIDKSLGAKREVVGKTKRCVGPSQKEGFNGSSTFKESADNPGNLLTAPASDDAKKWDGWNITLKPAHEPIVVARKPLVGTVAQNVLSHGTGAMNIKGCRVGNEAVPSNRLEQWSGFGQLKNPEYTQTINEGRYPSNLIHDGSDDVVSRFPNAKGQQGALTGDEPSSKTKDVFGKFAGRVASTPRVEGDKSAARFFFCAKANKKDREVGNKHPTVKPTELMRYLCRLVTQPGGMVLDPFMGSGSTGKAAMKEGFRFIGIDSDVDSVQTANHRIRRAYEECNPPQE
jgi:site-specific DNA-methyltransferase (adenine-specific)